VSLVALTIAGSDPSGGAGVQADLRVFAALDVAGLSAISALTVQDSRGVHAVFPVPAGQLEAQLEATLADSRVRAVKIGMLGDRAQVEVVAAALRRFRPPNVVLDPVLAATDGTPLLTPDGRAVLLELLLPLCTLVTPNLAELAALAAPGSRLPAPVGEAAGRPSTSEPGAGRPSFERSAYPGPEAAPQAHALLQRGARAVLVKGGHRQGAPIDTLFRPAAAPIAFPGERVETPHTHGTGCFLSAAIAAQLAWGASLEDAIRRAKELLARALDHPVIVGRGRGYPGVIAAAAETEAHPTHAERLARLRGLYVLTDPDLRPDRGPEEIAAAALAGGARVLQLRDKRRTTAALVPLAQRLCRMAREAEALFIVNDRVDLALAADADGVHLGPDDMAPADARRLVGPNRLVGVSVSTVAEAEAVAPFASYLGVGAIFATQTKLDAGPPVGVERITEIKEAFPHHPLVAIGGIGARNLPTVMAAGADAAAVVSAVVAADDMQQATRELVRLLTAP
jgi:hydroxymethylpyrimidine kinase / phosphomethylpyrimidine kinase / thiamine-phosphate diphosphorylase